MQKRLKVREVIKLLENDGWYHDRTKGNHRMYKHHNNQTSQVEESMRLIPVVLEGDKPNWSGYVPSLPGCIAAADSMEETLTLLREGIAIHLESMAEDGEEIPEEFLSEFNLDVQIVVD